MYRVKVNRWIFDRGARYIFYHWWDMYFVNWWWLMVKDIEKFFFFIGGVVLLQKNMWMMVLSTWNYYKMSAFNFSGIFYVSICYAIPESSTNADFLVARRFFALRPSWRTIANSFMKLPLPSCVTFNVTIALMLPKLKSSLTGIVQKTFFFFGFQQKIL